MRNPLDPHRKPLRALVRAFAYVISPNSDIVASISDADIDRISDDIYKKLAFAASKVSPSPAAPLAATKAAKNAESASAVPPKETGGTPSEVTLLGYAQTSGLSEPTKTLSVVDALSAISGYWAIRFPDHDKPIQISEVGIRTYLDNQNLGRDVRRRALGVCAVIDESRRKLHTSPRYPDPTSAFMRIMSNVTRGTIYGALKADIQKIASK